MGFLDSLMTYAVGNWSVTSEEKLSKEEIQSIDKVVVIEKEQDWGTSTSMCFFMKGGGQKYVPLSRDSDLVPGEQVNPKSITIITLERDGDDPIYRADGDSL